MNDSLTPELIEKTKAKLSFPDKLFIGGNYANSLTGKTFNNISPIDGKNINDVTFSQKEMKIIKDNLNGSWVMSKYGLSKRESKEFLEKLKGI